MIFRIAWACQVKANGVRKSRACLDGSKRAAPWLRMMVQTHSSCVEHPCLRLFVATCANRGCHICFGGVGDAHQQALSATLTKLEDNCFTVAPSKCEWAKDQAVFLGFNFTQQGVRPWKKKIGAILKLKPPTNKKEV